MTSRGGPLQLFPLCVGGNTVCLLLEAGSGDPPAHHSRGGSWVHKRFAEKPLNTWAMTRQWEAFRAPGGVPAPPSLCLGFSHFPENWSIVSWRTRWSGLGIWGRGSRCSGAAGEGCMGWPSLRSRAKSERRAHARGVCKGRDGQRGDPSRVRVGEGSLSASAERLGMQMRCKAARGGGPGFWLSAQVRLRA